VPWSSLKPVYRGKEKKDASKLDLKSVKRFSIMSRRYDSRILLHAKTLTRHSFFGDQEGDFSLTIKSIKAVSQSLDLEGGIAAGQNVRLRAGSRL
jgi:hypothetical protein